MRLNYSPNTQELTGFRENTRFNVAIWRSRCLPNSSSPLKAVSKRPRQELLPRTCECAQVGTQVHVAPVSQKAVWLFLRGCSLPSHRDCRLIQCSLTQQKLGSAYYVAGIEGPRPRRDEVSGPGRSLPKC